MGYIIAVSNQKGGVGKTTTSVNLAACLGEQGFQTLLVDLDPQGNATTAVGVNPRDLSSTLYRTLIGLDTPDPISLNSKISNLWLLPSSMDLAGAEFDLAQLENREYRLQSTLKSLDTDFDYVIIDPPPSLNLLSINALTAADGVLVPVQAEFMALEGLAHLMNTLDRITANFNPSLDLMGIAVTLYDKRTRLAGEVAAELARAFPGKVFETKIGRTVRLSEAPSHGLPIIYYDPKSAGAEAYRSLTQEVLHVREEARSWARA